MFSEKSGKILTPEIRKTSQVEHKSHEVSVMGNGWMKRSRVCSFSLGSDIIPVRQKNNFQELVQMNKIYLFYC